LEQSRPIAEDQVGDDPIGVGLVFPGTSIGSGGGQIADGAGEIDQVRVLTGARALNRLFGEEAIGAGRKRRKLQAEMAVSGYDEAKTRLLITTNWIRTIAFLVQALLAMAIVIREIGAG
jgi:hypothetical protein